MIESAGFSFLAVMSRVVHSKVRDFDSNLLRQRGYHSISRVNPAVRVEHFLRNFRAEDARDGVAYELTGRQRYACPQQDSTSDSVVQLQNEAVYLTVGLGGENMLDVTE